jgi:hypothetical protein
MALPAWEVVRSLNGDPTGVGPITWNRDRQWSVSTRTRQRLPVLMGTLRLHEHYGALRQEQPLCLACVPQRPFGGVRYWLVCPGCGMLRRALFLRGSASFRCRVCERIAYPSERMSPRKRVIHKKVKTGRRILYYWDIPNRPPPRPKGMHARTYQRLVTHWRALDRAAPVTGRKRKTRWGSVGLHFEEDEGAMRERAG